MYNNEVTPVIFDGTNPGLFDGRTMRLRRGGTPQRLYFGSLVPTPASRRNSVPQPGHVSAHHAGGSRPSPYCCQKRIFQNSMENHLARFAIGTVIHPWFSSVEETAGGGPGMKMAQWSRKSNRLPDVLGGRRDRSRHGVPGACRYDSSSALEWRLTTLRRQG